MGCTYLKVKSLFTAYCRAILFFLPKVKSIPPAVGNRQIFCGDKFLPKANCSYVEMIRMLSRFQIKEAPMQIGSVVRDCMNA